MSSHRRFRDVLAVLAVAWWFVWLIPPLASWARQYEFVQALQFESFSLIAPVLFVAGAPWRRLGGQRWPIWSRSPTVGQWGSETIVSTSGVNHGRSIAAGGLFVALAVAWRVAPVVDAVVRHPWLTVAEFLSLGVSGVLLFRDLIESPPLTPRASRPYRIGISAVVMWFVWIVAYMNGMSRSSWYHAFVHTAGHGPSLAADQQLSVGSIWIVSAAVFLPIIFWNLVQWLQSEEDPDAELYRLVRRERARGFFGTKN